ncbi:hypothetical protein Desti_2666 [Desulfomonile tiedjei DSM 6799]|uniref:Uncharacterized protein n=2 Tax=Desulfomonile tiedjei TaxID=2358 RepID=I4C704_DESTA|nr:hypothetical protein Desti_2666 [Desulfomonile tiedjei DSM 6799]
MDKWFRIALFFVLAVFSAQLVFAREGRLPDRPADNIETTKSIKVATKPASG